MWCHQQDWAAALSVAERCDPQSVPDILAAQVGLTAAAGPKQEPVSLVSLAVACASIWQHLVASIPHYSRFCQTGTWLERLMTGADYHSRAMQQSQFVMQLVSSPTLLAILTACPFPQGSAIGYSVMRFRVCVQQQQTNLFGCLGPLPPEGAQLWSQLAAAHHAGQPGSHPAGLGHSRGPVCARQAARSCTCHVPGSPPVGGCPACRRGPPACQGGLPAVSCLVCSVCCSRTAVEEAVVRLTDATHLPNGGLPPVQWCCMCQHPECSR